MRGFCNGLNIIHQEWSGISVKQHKDLKNLETQNLRDHMTEAERIFTALAELSTRQIAESMDATGLKENAERSGEGLATRDRPLRVPLARPSPALTVKNRTTGCTKFWTTLVFGSSVHLRGNRSGYAVLRDDDFPAI